MSVSALDEMSFEPSQWDNFAEFLDHEIGGVDTHDMSWPDANMTSLGGSPGDMDNSTSVIHGATTISMPPAGKSLESFSSLPIQVEEITRSLKTRKMSKGRPKLTIDDPSSAIERRRTQVRLAQRAYRQRREATIEALRAETEDIQKRLTTVQQSFDKLLEITLRPGSRGLHLQTIYSLCKTVEDSRLRPISRDESNKSDRNPTLENPISVIPDIKDIAADKFDEGIDRGLSFRSPRIEEDIADVTRRTPTREMIQGALTRSCNSPLGPSPSSPVSFALRLRHEALRRGYHLITNQDTSFSLLCRAFKYSIFSESRQSIVRRLHYLLHESSKFMYQKVEAENATLSDPINPHESQKALEFFDSPRDYTFGSKTKLPTTGNEHDTNEAVPDSAERYIDAEGVEQYLLERGLAIDAGSDFIALPARPTQENSIYPTLFDEIRGRQELRFSLNKLLYGT